jgi:hypothetical protein
VRPSLPRRPKTPGGKCSNSWGLASRPRPLAGCLSPGEARPA